MSRHKEFIEQIRSHLRAGHPPASIDDAYRILLTTTENLRLQAPRLPKGERLFRVRRMPGKPTNRSEVGPPPAGCAQLGRLNLPGESVLYLADSPATAFAEVRAAPGDYSLSEWVTTADRIQLANGGFDEIELRDSFGGPIPGAEGPLGGVEDREVANLYRDIFSLDCAINPHLYWWSIACGRVNRFASKCERTGIRTEGANTIFEGKFPLAGIAYLSVQNGRRSLNYCFNDLGMRYVELVNVQWVTLAPDGTYHGQDISTSWRPDGALDWKGRPANVILGPGQIAHFRKLSAAAWECRMDDGSLPRVD